MAKYDEWGREIPDDTPVEVPLNFKRPESIHEMIARGIRTHMSQLAALEGKETFEEANDFGDEDDEDIPPTPYELRAAYDEDTMTHLARIEREKQRRRQHGSGEGVARAEGVGRAGKENEEPGKPVKGVDGGDSKAPAGVARSGPSGGPAGS